MWDSAGTTFVGDHGDLKHKELQLKARNEATYMVANEEINHNHFEEVSGSPEILIGPFSLVRTYLLGQESLADIVQ